TRGQVVIHHTALHCGGIQEYCTVYEGRGWGVMGTHTKGNNHNSLAIAFMGNFNSIGTNGLCFSVSSVKQLLQCGVSQGHFHPVFILLGHRDLRDTECPGERLYAALKHLKSPEHNIIHRLNCYWFERQRELAGGRDYPEHRSHGRY
uniref:Peptidoglycan recognition protein family domain-containing protein n=1 Tax=Oncorhynchus mykiss TaxID=8022 RepID=A0A8K9XQK7_ONCMY